MPLKTASVNKKHILIVDDNPIQIKLLRIQLINAGFQVRTAINGKEALALIQENIPDAVISDSLMPEMDGFELCIAIRANTSWSHVSVILLSTQYLEKEDAMLAEQSGADAYLTDSNDIDKLLTTLQACLNTKIRRQLKLDASFKEKHAERVKHQLERQLIQNQSLTENINNLKKVERELAHKATHDVLTGLPNRTFFLNKVTETIASVCNTKSKAAMLFIDLDNFKMVNDEYGHDTGDKLLRYVVSRLQPIFRKADTFARLSGDEFVVVIPDQTDIRVISNLAERILEVIRKPFNINNHNLHVTCSIGISIYPDHGIDATTLLKKADSAMYKAKSAGRNTFLFYEVL